MRSELSPSSESCYVTPARGAATRDDATETRSLSSIAAETMITGVRGQLMTSCHNVDTPSPPSAAAAAAAAAAAQLRQSRCHTRR